MSISSGRDDATSIPAKTIQVIRKKSFKGSSLPPQIFNSSSQKNLEFRTRLPAQLPLMRQVPDIEARINELEQKAKAAEEIRLDREKERKFNMNELRFPPDKEIPEVPSEFTFQLQQLDFTFPSKLLPKGANGKRVESGQNTRDMPIKITKHAELPLDPHFAMQIELMTKLKAKADLTLDSTLEEGDAEYINRIDSQGRKANLRKVNCKYANTSQPDLTSLLTVKELKSRARSLAYAQFKKEKREMTKKLLLGQLSALKACVGAIIFYQKLKRFYLARKANDDRFKSAAKSAFLNSVLKSSKNGPNIEIINSGTMTPTPVTDKNLSEPQTNRAPKQLDTIPETIPVDASKNFSSARSLGPAIITGDYENVLLDMEGLKKFLDTVGKCKGLSKSFYTDSGKPKKGKKKKKPQKTTSEIPKLDELLVQSAFLDKKMERKMQQDALKKAFGLDIEI